MNKDFIFWDDSEQPLDHIATDGGYCSIFRTIACVGDSLSSGEFEKRDANGNTLYYDHYDYSWGQYLARMCGSKVYNFSRGGMSAMEYCKGFAESKNFWSPAYAAQAYIIALGVNDLIGSRGCKQPVGSVEDVCLEDHNKNSENFAGYYAKIIQRYKEIQPNAKFFLMTMPTINPMPENPNEDTLSAYRHFDEHAELLQKFTEIFDNCYLLDLRRYGPDYTTKDFHDRFFLHGHLNPCGYLLTAQMVASYIDYIIRHNMEDFKEVGFI